MFLLPFALSPSPLLFHNPFALRLSNKSHLIVHFLSWPGAWCQTSCMKCSFTAFPASTFVQRKNNKKSHRASWTLWGFFFLLLKRRRNSSWFIVCFTAMSLKRNSATIACRYTRRPYFFSWLRKSCFCVAFMDCYCKNSDRAEELERISEELIEVWSVLVFQLSSFPLLKRFLFLV